MPDGAVKGDLPTPEQERHAILALIAFLVLGVIGIASLIGAVALVLIKTAQWVFS